MLPAHLCGTSTISAVDSVSSLHPLDLGCSAELMSQLVSLLCTTPLKFAHTLLIPELLEPLQGHIAFARHTQLSLKRMLQVAFDVPHHMTMKELNQRVSPRELIVGW